MEKLIEELTMARIPAICDKCSTIFPSGFNIAKVGAQASLSNCKAGPCPRCGGDGTILDGVYKAIDNATTEAFVGKQSIDKLKQLLGVLELAKKKQWGREEVIANINKTTPAFAKIADRLPKSRTELYAFIVIIIMVINTLINSGKNILTKDELTRQTEVTINNYYETNSKNQSVTKPTLPVKDIPINKKRVGRNDPCPCGSGKKYKKCCGR